MSKRLNDRYQKPLARGGGLKKSSTRLSSREAEVLQLIAEGKPNKQVAAELNVSFKTVDKHRQHLTAKLNIQDVAGLTRYAIGAGIIESNVPVSIVQPRRLVGLFSLPPSPACSRPGLPCGLDLENRRWGETPHG
jgi:DNA-binding CsgD family transcriptional regulator